MIYNVKDGFLLTKKKVKEYLGGNIYEDFIRCRKYRVEIENENEEVFLHRIETNKMELE